MAIELATAYISIVPDVRGFERKLKETFAGRRDLHAKVVVEPDVRGFQRKLKAALAGQDVRVDVDVNTRGAIADVERFRASQRGKAVNLAVDVDTRKAKAQTASLRRSLEDLGRSDLLKLNIGATALASLPVLAAGLAEVASAMQQVAQAALAIPGGIAGAASSIGTLALGLTGVKDAYDAVTAASDEASTSGSDQAAQARASVSASNSLRNAIVDEAQARKDVTRATKDAQQALQDLRVEQRGGVIDEKRAVLEAQKAREALFTGDFSDVRDALLRVEEADQRVIEVRERNRKTTEKLNETAVKGIAGSDQVVAANERLVRAQQGVADAQASVATSAPKASAAQEKAAQAMAKLAPNAREFVKAMQEVVQGPGMELRNLVQDNIFDGLADQLNGLSEKALPTLEKGLGAIGKAWNKNITEVFETLGEDENISFLERIFGNTAETQSILTGTIDPIIEAVGTLAAAGSDSLPRLADAFTGATERFADFITKADSDGRLQRWIDEGITSLGHLGNTALNVGKMFTGITNAAGVSNLLADIDNLTNKWQTFLNSAEGQRNLQEIFAQGKQLFQEWKPVLEDVPGLFKAIYDGANTYLSGIAEILDPITSFLADHPGLVSAAVDAWLKWTTISAIAGTINTLTTAVNGLTLALGGSAVAGTAGAAATPKGAGLLGILKNPAYIFPAAILYSILFGDKDTNPQTQTSGGAGQPQLPGVNLPGGNGQLPGFSGPGQHPGPPQTGGGGSSMPQIRGSYGLPTGANSGGYGGGGVQFPDWVNQIADAFGIKPSTYSGHQTSNRNEAGYAPNPQGLNRGIDWSGPVQNMQKFADYLATVPGGLEQVIWQNPGTGATVEIAGGRPQPGYFSGDLGGHQNHVHTRQSAPIPLPTWWRQTYDQGGWLPPGATMAINATGKPEMILTPEQLQALASQGIDPNTLLHGTGNGAAPGPTQQAIDALAAPGQGSDVGSRTEGYIPAAAGSTGVAGTSFAASLLNLGNEAVAAGIDAGAGAAKAAAAVGTFGAGAGAGAGIDIVAGLAKRGASYGFQMASIGVDALVEQLTPFGAPRWLGYDYTGFMPQLGITPALTTSLEQAVAQQGRGEGTAPPMPPGTEHMLPGAQPGVPVPPGPPPGALPSSPGAPPPGLTPGAGTPPFGQPPTPSGNMSDPNYWKNMFGFDQGGWMQPGSYGVNMTNRPEPVFTGAQWSSIEKSVLAPDRGGQFGVRIENLYAADADDVKRKIDSQQRLAMMRYSGRP